MSYESDKDQAAFMSKPARIERQKKREAKAMVFTAVFVAAVVVWWMM